MARIILFLAALGIGMTTATLPLSSQVRSPAAPAQPTTAQTPPSTTPQAPNPAAPSAAPTAAAEEQTRRLVVMLRGRQPGAGDAPETIGAGIIFGIAQDRIYIVTANHVVRQGVEQTRMADLEVLFHWLRGEWQSAEALPDFDSAADLAVVAVRNARTVLPTERAQELLFDRLGPAVQRRDLVYTIGYPEGQPWYPRVTPDIVADVTADTVAFESTYLVPGHSGGALVDANGGIVGLIQRDLAPLGVARRIDAVTERLSRWGYPVRLTALRAPARGTGTARGGTPADARGPTGGRASGPPADSRGAVSGRGSEPPLRSSALWPIFGYDALHTNWNRAETALSLPFGRPRQFTTEGLIVDSLSAAGGRLYIGGGRGRGSESQVVALLAETFERVWAFSVPGTYGTLGVTPVAQVPTGPLIVGGRGAGPFALDYRTGEQLRGRWPPAGDMFSRHPLWTITRRGDARVDTLYYLSMGSLIAFDLTRSVVKWSARIGAESPLSSPIALGPYVVLASPLPGTTPSGSGTILVFDAEMGTPVRRFRAPMTRTAYPVGSTSGTVVFSASAQDVAAFDVETGETVWQTTVPGDPALARVSLAFADDTLLVGFARPGRRPAILAMNARSGKVNWTFDIEGGSIVRGPVVAGGIVYFAGGLPAAAFGLDLRTGKMLWRDSLSGSPSGDPIIAYGKVWVPAGQTIHAFGP